MPLNLCTAPGTNAVAVDIALEESGLAYKPVRMDFATSEQQSDQPVSN